MDALVNYTRHIVQLICTTWTICRCKHACLLPHVAACDWERTLSVLCLSRLSYPRYPPHANCAHHFYQVLKVDELKVLQTFVLYIDEFGTSMTLCEILHTTRDCYGYLACLQYIDRELSRVLSSKGGPTLASRIAENSNMVGPDHKLNNVPTHS